MTNKFKSLLGMCRRAGRLVLGADDLEKNSRRVVVAFTANDVSENTLKRINGSGVRSISSDMTKSELGELLGCGEVAVAAVTDKNFAEALERNI